MAQDPEPLEELLALALAAHDQGGDPALEAFLARHPADRGGLERGLQRCRQMGLLDGSKAPRDFPERLGEFRLRARLGGGGMGVVYEAEQESLARRVALKVVRPELLYFEGARERFRREIEAIARLSHPAIVPVLASGEQDGVPWYAMELLPGRTVHQVCQELRGRDPATLTGDHLRQLLVAGGADTGSGTDPFAGPWWQVATRIAWQVALGVRHAHLRGIVHRDIKPSNVMLTADGRTVLLDFGVALVGGRGDFTRTGNTPGSPAFMSPEQLRGQAVDERTDVYSLGATLWQLLALEPPFPATQPLQRLRDAEPPRLRTRHRHLPPELELVVRTAMDPDRERRYSDAEAFAEDLQAVLHRRPIRARRLGLPLRGLRWCQRHRTAATMLASLATVALLLPLVFAWRERSVNQELAAAVETADRSFATTLDTIDRMLVALANERLRFVPQAQPVMVEALRQACAMYSNLLPRHPDHPRLRVAAADAHGRLAGALQRTGDHAAASEAFRTTLALLPEAQVTADPGLRETRASTLVSLANLHLDFRADAELQAAVAGAQRDFTVLAALPVHRPLALIGLSQCAMLEAEALERQGEPQRTQAALERSVQLARDAVAANPGNTKATTTLVRQLDNLATAHIAQKQPGAAEPLLTEALQLARALPDDVRAWPPPAVLLSDVLETLGGLRFEPRRLEVAAAHYQECIALRERAAADFPEDIELRARLGGALHNLARTHCGDQATEAELGQALALLERAIAIQRAILASSPQYDRARTFLMLHLRLSGNCHVRRRERQPLVAVARELLGDLGSANHLRATARFWLRAAELLAAEAPPDEPALRAEYLQQALTALLAAERAGWGSKSRLDEAVYAPLEGLPEFEALRARRRAAAEPPASTPSGSTPQAPQRR
jgi:serine/threonine protein kinase